MRIVFDKDHTPKGHAPDRPSYKAGKAYEFSGPVALTYAKKYVIRGFAHEVGAPDVATVDAAKAQQAQLDLDEAERKAEEAAKLAERSAVEIPDDVDGLSWHELRALASRLTDDTVRNKEDALSAIQAERGRRAIAG